MKKQVYNTPMTDISVWEKTDVITSSAISVVDVNVVSSLGDKNVTAQISYDDIGLSK